MGFEYLKIKEAEKIAGTRLDRRRKYFLWEGVVCFHIKFTSICTGCCDDSEYANDSIGSGCCECGYTGKRRGSAPMPVNLSEI